MVELNYEEVDEKINIRSILYQGECIIIRNSPEVKKFREELIGSLKNSKQKNEMFNFYEHHVIPSEKTIHNLFQSLKSAREAYYLGTLLYNFIKKCHFEKDIYIDGGISRFVVPVHEYEKFYISNLFDDNDFSRKFSGDNVEMFMNGVSNIHRDFNRTHLSEMYNFWIPMHNMDASEVLQIFEEDFFKDIKDMDNYEKNYSLLSSPQKYHLNFGDFVIFHSEQLHVSPKRCEKTTRRHSFDFRLATKCHDDNGHYRSNFKNLENFHLNNADEKSYELCMVPLKNCNARQAYVQYKKAMISLDDLLDIYKKLPYTEDRYVELAKELIGSNPDKANKIIDFAIKKTGQYFWIYKFAKLYDYLGDIEKSNHFCKKLLKLAEITISSEKEYPITYTTPLKELLKEDIEQKEKQHNNLVIIPKGYVYNIEKVLASLHDIEMIIPLEVETHLTYIKKASIRSIYSNKFAIDSIDSKRFENKVYENIYCLISSIDSENKAIFDFLSLLKSKNFYRIYPDESLEDIAVQIRNRINLSNTSYISPLAKINSSVMIGTEGSVADLVTIDDYVTIKDRVDIGRCTGISTHVHVYNDCSIGSFTAIGANSVIAGPHHHIETFTISNKVEFTNLKHQANYTYIGHDVWIGANVTVKANVKIGNGAVIGASSFVNRDIPPYAIAFGVPAKVYSFRFDHKTIKKLNESEWWDIEHIEQVKFDIDIEKSLKMILKRKKKCEKNITNFDKR